MSNSSTFTLNQIGIPEYGKRRIADGILAGLTRQVTESYIEELDTDFIHRMISLRYSDEQIQKLAGVSPEKLQEIKQAM